MTFEALYNQQDTVINGAFPVQIKITGISQKINTVEGTLTLNGNGNAKIEDISLGGSDIVLWTEQPSAIPGQTEIRFSGGIPGGSSESSLSLFSVILSSDAPDSVEIGIRDAVALAHDGQGTPLALPNTSHAIQINAVAPQDQQDAWTSVLGGDTTKPASFKPVIGRDPSMFGNQYFLSFSTTDAQSGIDHYEVREGDGPYVTAQSPYLIADQSLEYKITVKAVDKAGNERIATANSSSGMGITIGVIVALAVIIAIVAKKRRR